MRVHNRCSRALLAGALAACLAPAAAAAAPVSTKPPSVRGTLAFGQSVRCDPGEWSGSPTAFRYDWVLNGSARGSGSRFAIDDPYLRSFPLACQVTATDAAGATGVASSPAVQPARGRAKIVVARFLAQPRGGILAVGKVTPKQIPGRWDGGTVVLRRTAPGRRAFYQLGEPVEIRRDGGFRVSGVDAAGRWTIRLDFSPRAIDLWDPAEVTRRLTITAGGRQQGGGTVIG